jgi:hypothetical protein
MADGNELTLEPRADSVATVPKELDTPSRFSLLCMITTTVANNLVWLSGKMTQSTLILTITKPHSLYCLIVLFGTISSVIYRGHLTTLDESH